MRDRLEEQVVWVDLGWTVRYSRTKIVVTTESPDLSSNLVPRVFGLFGERLIARQPSSD